MDEIHYFCVGIGPGNHTSVCVYYFLYPSRHTHTHKQHPYTKMLYTIACRSDSNRVSFSASLPCPDLLLIPFFSATNLGGKTYRSCNQTQPSKEPMSSIGKPPLSVPPTKETIDRRKGFTQFFNIHRATKHGGSSKCDYSRIHHEVDPARG